MCKELLGEISGYKQKYEITLAELQATKAKLNAANDTIARYKDIIATYERGSKRPKPLPISGTIEYSSAWINKAIEDIALMHYGLDSKYYLVDQKTMLDLIAWDWIDAKEYRKDIFDCEDYAFAFKAHIAEYYGINQIGIILDYSSAHGYNLIIFPNGKIWLFEPQTDSLFFIPSRNKKLYALEHGVLIL